LSCLVTFHKRRYRGITEGTEKSNKVDTCTENLLYNDRLIACNVNLALQASKRRRDRNLENTTQTYVDIIGIQATIGNDLRIFISRFKYDLRKFYFTNRAVDRME